MVPIFNFHETHGLNIFDENGFNEKEASRNLCEALPENKKPLTRICSINLLSLLSLAASRGKGRALWQKVTQRPITGALGKQEKGPVSNLCGRELAKDSLGEFEFLKDYNYSIN